VALAEAIGIDSGGCGESDPADATAKKRFPPVWVKREKELLM